MANKTIKEIIVHPKFVVGETWCMIDNGEALDVEILTRPYWRPHYDGCEHGYWAISLKDKWDLIHYNSLGDLGVKGFEYDNRPARLFRNVADAKKVIAQWNDWFANDYYFD